MTDLFVLEQQTPHTNGPQAWRKLAQAFYAHHVNCPICQAAGRGARYGLRCGIGASLWTEYQSEGTE